MAASLGLPEGFELETPEVTDNSLPDGFELESAPVEDLANEPISPEVQAASDASTVSAQSNTLTEDEMNTPAPAGSEVQPKGKFASFIESFKSANKPNSEVLYETLPNDPNKVYGEFLPYAKDKITGKAEWAVPNAIRSTVHGMGNLFNVAEDSARDKEYNLNSLTTEGALTAAGFLVGGASGTKFGKPKGAVEAVTPKGEPVLDSKFAGQQADLQNELAKGQQESLAQVALGARNPTTLTAEQYTEALAKTPEVMSPKGAEAEMARLERQYDSGVGTLIERENIKKEMDRLADIAIGKTKAEVDVAKELNSEQFATNIYYPVQNAIDSGAPIASIEQELRSGLQAANRTPEEIEDLVNAAIPQELRQVDTFADEVAKAEGVNPTVARGVMPPSLTTDDGSILAPLTAGDLKLKGKLRSKMADSTNMLSLIGRQYAKKNGINVGSQSLRELDDLTAVRNLSQRGSVWWRSIVGNPTGKDKGILWGTQGSELKPDLNVDNFHASIQKARAAGMTSDDMEEVINVYNAYDDYANIDRIVSDAQTKLQATTDPKEIKELNALIAEYQNKESFLTRAEVQAGEQKFANDPNAQAFLQNKNKINKKLIEGLADSGRISTTEANRLLAAHPNYAPAWRDVEDFSFANIEVSNSGGSTQPFKFRKISDKDVRSPIETTTNNIINNIRKIEQTQYRAGALNYLIPKLDDGAWKVLFREDKADVLKAMADIRTGKKQKWAADEITPKAKDKVQKVGNITFDIDGGQIQLTIKDPQIFQEFSQARMWESTNAWYDKLEKLAHFNRNMISLDPQFSLRNIQRESMDAIVGGKTSFFQKLKSPATNIKNVFAKELSPDLYEHITNNIGYASQRGQGLYGVDDVGKLSASVARGEVPAAPTGKRSFMDIFKDQSSGNQGGSAVQGLENFANRFDMAPRISVYEWTLRDGLKSGLTHDKAHEAAIFAAKNLGVNFTQRGSNTGFDKVIRIVPFSRSFINSTDRMVMLGRYEPARLARNTFVGLYMPYLATKEYNNQFKDVDGVPYQDKLDPSLKKDMLPIYGPWSEGVNDYFPLRLGWVYGRALPAMDKSLSYMTQEFGERIHYGIEQDLPKILEKNKETKDINPKEVLGAWTDYITGVAQPGTVVPPIARQAIEMSTNKDYLGRPIVPDYLKDVPPSAQYTENTPKVLSDFSYYLSKRGIEVSPLTSQYLLNSMFASAGNYSLQGADLIYNASSNREKPQIEGKDIPFLPLVSGKTTSIPKEGIEGQFANVGKYLESVNAQHDAIVERTKVDPNAFQDLQTFEIENAPALNYYEEYVKLRSNLRPIRNTSTNIVNAPKDKAQGYQTPETEFFGDPKKREAVDKLRTTSIDAQKAFLKKIQTDPNADDLWYERLTRKPLTQAVEGIVGSSKTVDKPKEKEYTPPSTFDDSKPGFFDGLGKGKKMDIQPMSMTYDSPPAIERQAPDLMNEDVPYKPGFFEKYLPNVRKEVVNKYKDTVLNRTLDIEGGYVDNPRDNGGVTNHGVTLATLRMVNPKATSQDVKALSKEKAKEIYSKIYWDDAQVDKIPIQLQDVVFDGNINHGVPGMTKIVQRALNDLGADLKADGKMGNKTLNAINSMDAKDVREAIIKRRKNLYEQHEDVDTFGKGWFKRLDALKDIPKEARA